MSERLEEIKQHILNIDEDDSTNRGRMLDYRHWAYKLLQIGFEQAERVQELKHDKEHLELIKERQEEEYRNVYEQNKRYREALLKIDDYDIEVGDMRDDLQNKLLQIKYIKDEALEDESE